MAEKIKYYVSQSGTFLGVGLISGALGKSIFDRILGKPNENSEKVEAHEENGKFGLPMGTGTLRYKSFVVGYDSCRKTPSWVSQILTLEKTNGNAKRERCCFRKDPGIDKDFSADHEDFLNSGFSKGHMAPAADSRKSQIAMEETFYYSNIVPQNFENNSGIWHRMERFCRMLTKKYSKVYVVSGPLFIPKLDEKSGQKIMKYQVIGENEVAVPTHLYKVILIEKEQEPFAIGSFVVPNSPISSEKPIDDFFFPLKYVETKLGYKIFPKLNKQYLKNLLDIESCKLISQEIADKSSQEN